MFTVWCFGLRAKAGARAGMRNDGGGKSHLDCKAELD